MKEVLLVVHMLIAIAMVISILMQRSSSDGFGMGSGSGNALFSSRGTANFLSRTTAILATLFIVSSLALTLLVNSGTGSSIVDVVGESPAPAAAETPAEALKPATPAVPLAQ